MGQSSFKSPTPPESSTNDGITEKQGQPPLPPLQDDCRTAVDAMPSSEDGDNATLAPSGSRADLTNSQSADTNLTIFGPDYDLPRLRGFNLWHRKWSAFGYATFILMCNLALPCVLYYVLKDHTNLSGHALLGVASATLGVSSSFDNPFRMWKLWKHRDLYGPLNDTGPWWHLDWTMHLYSFALFPVFAIPLAVSSSVDPPLYNFFNMSTPIFVAVPGIFFLVSLFKVKCPFWMSSDAPGTPMKPGVFYLFEDIGAVDFRHGKEFRRQLHARYNASPVYRDLMWWETVFWVYGCTVYFAITAAVNWTTPFWFSYGFILGLLFLWLVSWAAMSIFIAKYFHRKEERWLALKKKGDAELARAMTLEGINELAIEASRRRRSEIQARRSRSERRMSERHTNEFRHDMREQLARRAMTENDVTAVKQAKREIERQRQKERGNSFNPSVPAIPPRRVEELARVSSRKSVSGELHRTLSPQDMDSTRDNSDPTMPRMHPAQSR